MSLKFGEVCEVKSDQTIVYFDGYCQRDLSVDVFRGFSGDQIKELHALVGHCISVLKDRSGRIQQIQIID